MVLLRLVAWLRRESDLEISILLGAGGPLVEDYRAIAPTTVLDPATLRPTPVDRGLRRMRRTGLAEARATDRIRRAIAPSSPVDVLYLNSVGSLRLAKYLAPKARTVITHVHELQIGMDLWAGPDRPALRALSDHYIAAAHCVADMLVEREGIDRGCIDVCHEFVDVEAASEIDVNSARAAVRSELGIPPDAFVVGSAGTLTWRKGPDLFLAVATAMQWMRDDAAYFLWVGGARPNQPETIWMERDFGASPVAPFVHTTGDVADPLRHLAAIDVFALTSREDPFPLVALEAGALGIPVVAFDVGGTKEWVDDACGAVVGYADIIAMACALVRLGADLGLTRVMGAEAQRRVRSRYGVADGATRIADVLGRFLTSRPVHQI